MKVLKETSKPEEAKREPGVIDVNLDQLLSSPEAEQSSRAVSNL